jgi:tripartite-type tricarboxylate transporter receptor subunit TctC
VIAAPCTAQAQAFPNKPVRIVVPQTPGGASDALARIVGQKLSERWGHPVVIENKAGAGGNVGTDLVAKSPADGYTLLMGTPAHVINVSLYSGLSYDVIRDFAPVSLVSTGQYVVIVHPSVPARSAKQLIVLGKANPGALAFGSAGPGNSTHLAGELFNSMAGIRMLHVPYKGSGPALVDLMSGQLQVMFANITAGLPHIRTQRVRALAVTGPKRTPQAPDLPTVAEAVLPGYSVTSFFGVLAPTGTPAGVIAKLNAEIVKAAHSADVQASLAHEGAEAVGSSPEEFAAYMRAEIPRWTAAVKTAGLQGQVK